MPLDKADVDLNNLVPAVPLINRDANDSGLFRYGSSKPLETDGGSGNFAIGPAERSTFSMFRFMSSYGNGDGSDGNDGTLTVNGVVPTGPAYSRALQFTPGPRFGQPGYDGDGAVLGGGYNQSSLKSPLFVNVVQRRQSAYIPNRGDGFAGLVFNDAVGIQTTASLENTGYGRIYGGHYNVTLQPGSGGQAICLEMEMNNAAQETGQDIFSHRQKVGLQIVARGGDVTKGVSYVADGGGKFHTLVYVNPNSVMPAKQNPTTTADSGVPDIGGSYVRYAEQRNVDGITVAYDIYREALIDGEMVRANGHGRPRHSKFVVEHVKRPEQIVNIWEVTDGVGTGQIWQEYVVPNGKSRSLGYDRASDEIRIAAGTGLSNSVRASISPLHAAFFAPVVSSLAGGSNNLFIAEGVAAAAINGGFAFFSQDGIPRVVRGDGVAGTINVTWAS